jgi:hypothetical protein
MAKLALANSDLKVRYLRKSRLPRPTHHSPTQFIKRFIPEIVFCLIVYPADHLAICGSIADVRVNAIRRGHPRLAGFIVEQYSRAFASPPFQLLNEPFPHEGEF